MENSPLISIAMPAYNAEITIGYAIESVLCQTYKNFELIICNDASTDSTLNIISTIADIRLKIINNNKNMGEGHTRDHAISYATGQWITFIDADDAWHPKRLETLLKASRPGYIIFDNLVECVTKKNHLIKLSKVRSIFCFGNVILSPTVIELSRFIKESRLIMQPFFERTLVVNNNICHSNHTFGADTYFVLSMIKCGAKLLYVPKSLYFYRLTIGAASTNPKKIELMINTIELAKASWELNHNEEIAFSKKIKMLKKELRYYHLLSLIKNQKKYNAITFLLENLDLLLPAIWRAFFQMWKIIFCKLNFAESR